MDSPISWCILFILTIIFYIRLFAYAIKEKQSAKKANIKILEEYEAKRRK